VPRDIITIRRRGGYFTPVVSVADSVAYTNFIARALIADPTLDVAHQGYYRTLLNGLTTDGIFNSDGSSNYLDTLYIFAAFSAPVALLNLCSNASYNATAAGSPTFTANSGYSTASGTSYVTSNWTFSPNGVNYTQNSAHISGWVVGSSTATNAGPLVTSAVDTSLYPRFTDTLSYLRVNDTAAGLANANRQGFFLGNRSGATSRQSWQNDVSLGTSADASGSPAAHVMFFLSDASTADTVDTIAMGSSGGDLTPTVAGGVAHTAFYNRLRVYMTSVGVP
jgi:hypothetical protein